MIVSIDLKMKSTPLYPTKGGVYTFSINHQAQPTACYNRLATAPVNSLRSTPTTRLRANPKNRFTTPYPLYGAASEKGVLLFKRVLRKAIIGIKERLDSITRHIH